jgi:hypothetical protein
MDVHSGSKDGPRPGSLTEINASISKYLRQQQAAWAKELCQDPSRFGELEVAVHRTFQNLADQVMAGLLAEVGQHRQLADDAKKK